MKHVVSVIIAIFTLFVFITSAYAVPPPSSSGGPCDFGAWWDALGEQESNNTYDIENSAGFLGRWQLGKPGLSDIGWVSYPGGAWTGKAAGYGVTSNEEFKKNPKAQDEAMKQWMDRMAGEIRTFGLTSYVGKTISQCPSQPITWSGLLAGRHLCGIGKSSGGTDCRTGRSLKQLLESNGSVDGKDGNGTPVSKYVCSYSGYNVPYEHGNQYKAADCGTVNNAGETGGSGVPYSGSPGKAHDGVPNEPNPPSYQFYIQAQFIKGTWVASLQQITNQMTTFMMQQAQIIGTFLDAKHQLETQRLLQEKTAQAHKDYQPSVQMCEMGTFVRNLIDSEKRADLTQGTLSQAMLERALATGDVSTFKTGSDEETKKRLFIDKFCSQGDNAKQNEQLCKKSGSAEQQNADVNYTNTIDNPMTLEVNLLDGTKSPDEENLYAFLNYIFMHDAFPWMSRNETVLFNFIQPYQDMRSLIAMRSVAQNSFAKIIAQKTEGPAGDSAESVAPFIKSLMREMGMTDTLIEETIGKNPSYYAQMEILTKRIYQHPEFVSNLYDKPANVKRIRAALTAIKLMQDRDIHDALLRREMLMSILLELQLRKRQQDILVREIQPVLQEQAGEPE